MTWRRFDGDRGQAFPIYVVLVAGLLFAALAYFTIGKAAIVRSNAQGAADAAALAAAREARDALVPGLDLATLSPKEWEQVLLGNRFDPSGRACAAAHDFAAMNDATVVCNRSGTRFSVRSMTNGTVGDSVVPGTSGKHGEAYARAEIVPRCQVKPGGLGSGGGSAPIPEPPGPIKFSCDKGVVVDYDPAQPRAWRSLAAALFDIRLID
ncbi:pilus assembly protein TadG-related protein [Streptomyces sp. MB09-01]|uniref:pilus assembly protein TadG-related protein n=1 Tax=Streptomyces sp. MB09-01 TaxID=3028666 RepID=UPI0029A98BF5|nr:pilus assembly protein TadG-related protein [Streptomyces sp. MB09-01]MDX3539498.1 pilus assembly protein TadG-related protein [Streptomyces sp. MB09-01]